MNKILVLSVLSGAVAGATSSVLVLALVDPEPPSARAAQAHAPAEGPPTPADEPLAAAATAPGGAADGPLVTPRWMDRLDALEARLDALAAGLDAPAGARAPALPEDAGDQEAAESVPKLEDLVRQALDDSLLRRDLEQDERDRAARAERDRFVSEARARSVAQRLDLTDYERDQVAEVFRLELERRHRAFDDVRRSTEDPPSGAGREGFREAVEELREWKVAALEERLGPDLARQVLDADRGGRSSPFDRRGRGRDGARGEGGDGLRQR